MDESGLRYFAQLVRDHDKAKIELKELKELKEIPDVKRFKELERAAETYAEIIKNAQVVYGDLSALLQRLAEGLEEVDNHLEKTSTGDVGDRVIQLKVKQMGEELLTFLERLANES